MTAESLPDFIGDTQATTQSYDPVATARALLDQIHDSAFSMALTDGVDCWAGATDDRTGVPEYAQPLYDALVTLSVAVGWTPPDA